MRLQVEEPVHVMIGEVEAPPGDMVVERHRRNAHLQTTDHRRNTDHYRNTGRRRNTDHCRNTDHRQNVDHRRSIDHRQSTAAKAITAVVVDVSAAAVRLRPYRIDRVLL